VGVSRAEAIGRSETELCTSRICRFGDVTSSFPGPFLMIAPVKASDALEQRITTSTNGRSSRASRSRLISNSWCRFGSTMKKAFLTRSSLNRFAVGCDCHHSAVLLENSPTNAAAARTRIITSLAFGFGHGMSALNPRGDSRFVRWKPSLLTLLGASRSP
jgi:hypothetical protein